MRREFFELLKKEMREDESIFLLAADMGLGFIEDIQKEFRDRTLNVGISEQNMIGVASGLCNVGYRPFCYTISNFLIHRCFEQIRNDICYHNYPITLVGSSAGFDNGLLGFTHQVIDDIGCVKILPNMRIYSPSTVTSVRMVFEDIMSRKQPAYARIGKRSYDLGIDQRSINGLVKEHDESDLVVITHGTMLENCVKAAEINNNFSIYCMNRIKPLDREEIGRILKRYLKIVVVEDHMVTSGLYNSLCEIFVDMQCQQKHIYCIGPPEKYEDIVGDNNFFADRYGYSPGKIARFVSKLSLDSQR